MMFATRLFFSQDYGDIKLSSKLYAKCMPWFKNVFSIIEHLEG